MANHQMDNNLQIKDGNYTRIHNRILEELAKIQLSGYEIRIILALWRKTYGWQKKEDYISFKQFKDITGLPKSEISRTLAKLKKRNLVGEIYNSKRKLYKFNKHFTTWKTVVKIYNSCRNLHRQLWKSTSGDVEIYNQNPREHAPDNRLQSPKETLTKETITKENIYMLKFLNFWKEYPRKVAKQPALKAFIKLKPDDELFEHMMSSLAKQRDSPSWKENGGKFIPYPATWLNQKRWEDEIQIQEERRVKDGKVRAPEGKYRDFGI